jgi:CubicO group peptidase (beta-lactamase class C family)
MRPLLALIVFALTFNTALRADSPVAQKIDAYLQPYLTMQDFTGCVLVAKHGEVLIRKCYGDANYELKVVNTPNSKFHIASVTKSFTAAAIVILQKQGKLQITDKLSHYIPDFPEGDKITIAELLEHSSGIPSYYAIAEYEDLKLKARSLR